MEAFAKRVDSVCGDPQRAEQCRQSEHYEQVPSNVADEVKAKLA